MDKTEELKMIKSLYERGVLSKDDMEKEKARLLGGKAASTASPHINCPNCGANSIVDLGDVFQCEFCQTQIPKPKGEPAQEVSKPVVVQNNIYTAPQSKSSTSNMLTGATAGAAAGATAAGTGCLAATAMSILIPIAAVIGVVLFSIIFVVACANACSSAVGP